MVPIPASSGKRQRHRLNRGGNRQLHAALHRIAITQLRICPQTQAFRRDDAPQGAPTPRRSAAAQAAHAAP
jgi:transposase